MYILAKDSYVWTDCRVVGWEPEDRAFVVNYSGSEGPKTKKVKRLNLRFKVRAVWGRLLHGFPVSMSVLKCLPPAAMDVLLLVAAC